MGTNFADIPIAPGRNPYTNKPEGDDSGYRSIPTSSLDAENPDPLVVLNDVIRVHPIYAIGKTHGLCPYYERGLGASKLVLVRKPVLTKLIQARNVLEAYGLELVVLDGFRPYNVQSALWRYLRAQALKQAGLVEGRLSFLDELQAGISADNIGSYCAVLRNKAFLEAKDGLLTGANKVLITAASKHLSLSPEETAELYLSFNANLGRDGLSLDWNAPTAHGSGGAVDVWIVDRNTGQYANLGVPFDYISSTSIVSMDYFDHPDSFSEQYEELVRRDDVLARYLAELGFEGRIRRAFFIAQRMRRILFHTMVELGASYYRGEPWHFQFGNELGGNQASGELYGSGNACHAILKGKKEAVWGNTVAHDLARTFKLR